MKIKVLIVDDEQGIRTFLRLFLESKGYEVSDCEDGPQAIELIKENPPHLALIDMKMPLMSGKDLLKSILRLKKGVKIIIITAMEDPKMKKFAKRVGVIDYMLKPFNLSYLYKLIVEHIEKPNLPPPPPPDPETDLE